MFFSLALCACLTAVMDSPMPAKVDGKPFAVEVAMRLDIDEATVGEPIRLRELIPASSALRCKHINHNVIKIGRYDSATRRLAVAALNGFENRTIHLDEDFPGLSESVKFYHGMVFDVKTPGFKGTEFVFRARQPGIYLITTEWSVDEMVRPTCLPIVLKVRPVNSEK